MIQSPAVTIGSFTAAVQFEKLEIHKVFLRFHSKFLTQNSSPNLLVELCGVVLEFGVVKFIKYRLWYRFFTMQHVMEN